MKKPEVSIILPVYNARKYLKLAIDSILSQTFTNYELIMIDDGSFDGSNVVMKSYKDARIRLVTHKKNCGLVATLNEGISLARTKYIARMDADDISLPTRIEVQYEFLINNPDCLIVGCDSIIINDNNQKIGYHATYRDSATISAALGLYNCLTHGAVMYKKEGVVSAGLYNMDCKLAEDYDLWIRLLQLGTAHNIQEALYGYRINPSGLCSKNKKRQKKFVKEIQSRHHLILASDSVIAADTSDVWPEVHYLSEPINERRLAYSSLHLAFAHKYLFNGLRLTLAFKHLIAGYKLQPYSLIKWLGYISAKIKWHNDL